MHYTHIYIYIYIYNAKNIYQRKRSKNPIYQSLCIARFLDITWIINIILSILKQFHNFNDIKRSTTLSLETNRKKKNRRNLEDIDEKRECMIEGFHTKTTWKTKSGWSTERQGWRAGRWKEREIEWEKLVGNQGIFLRGNLFVYPVFCLIFHEKKSQTISDGKNG